MLDEKYISQTKLAEHISMNIIGTSIIFLSTSFIGAIKSLVEYSEYLIFCNKSTFLIDIII